MTSVEVSPWTLGSAESFRRKAAGKQEVVSEADLADLQRAHRKGLERELTMIPYVYAMFSTCHDVANRPVFQAEDADNWSLVGPASRGPKKDVGEAVTGLPLHR